MTSTLIGDSPTMGMDLSSGHATLMLGKNSCIESYLSDLREMASLDTLSVSVRKNETSLPLLDVKISFNQLIVSTCSDSFDTLVSYFSQFSTPSNNDRKEEETQMPKFPLHQQDIDTFGMLGYLCQTLWKMTRLLSNRMTWYMKTMDGI